MPARYTVASVVCSCGGLLLGMDMSIIGPVTVMTSFTNQFGEHSSVVHGILVSSILLAAAVSSFFAGRPPDAFGRPKALAFGAGIFTIGAVLQASAVSLVMFAIGRVIEGFGYGLYFGTQTVYICEIAPPEIRGVLTTMPQFMTCVALVIGFFTAYGTVNIEGSLSWRLPFIITAGMSTAYALANLFLLPDSPRWLILNGRRQEADKVWDLLGVKREDREAMDEGEHQEEQIALSQVLEEPAERANEKHATFADLWARDVRRRTFLAVFMMGFLQLCGIDAVLYYAPLLFQQAGLQTQQAAFLASGVSAIVIVVTSIPATLYADKWGRRTSTVVGGLGLSVTMLLIGSLYAGHAVQPQSGAGRWVVIVCIYLFCVIQATTWAISIKVWAPEIQPNHTRAQAISLAHGFNWVCNFFVAFICPILLAKSASGAYFLFGACTTIATIVSFFYMIETKGKSLDAIERAFRKQRPAGEIVMANLGHAVAVQSPQDNKRS
ncbi:hypothetical protein M409DRAFT_37484 [Zasmidium cellare ATCC 36951]|uniref:Major facilitator superfamily (MFS) profile domain-containing protein n=1 Tax=Zasmidium cellare ATCC 36951 TaxID=1080233 RepID=A0A6A6C4P8_ZASCE|nr:uncharacterized protein M409DRAFT_37484 [Zasmidium cellare ATCC 36951]KAF2161903.1 hypothetical protein M409DRAFT_37484 [Zasmidium cellare ATCC 36951]